MSTRGHGRDQRADWPWEFGNRLHFTIWNSQHAPCYATRRLNWLQAQLSFLIREYSAQCCATTIISLVPIRIPLVFRDGVRISMWARRDYVVIRCEYRKRM